jgi:O-methyltransferase
MKISKLLAALKHRLSPQRPDKSAPAPLNHISYAELNEEERALITRAISSQLSMTSENNLATTALACKYILKNQIEGDFMECGVWRGGHSIIAASMLRNTDKKIYMLDTFSGMTQPDERDVRVIDGQSAESIFTAKRAGPDSSDWCLASLDEVKKNIKGFGLESMIERNQTIFIKGKAEDVLRDPSTDLPNKISCLRLDTDWYMSTKAELEVLWPRISLGGILIIDDYSYWDGCMKAVNEYFINTKLFLAPIDGSARVAIKVSQ